MSWGWFKTHLTLQSETEKAVARFDAERSCWGLTPLIDMWKSRRSCMMYDRLVQVFIDLV